MAKATTKLRAKVRKKPVKFQPKQIGDGGVFTAKVATIVQKKKDNG